MKKETKVIVIIRIIIIIPSARRLTLTAIFISSVVRRRPLLQCKASILPHQNNDAGLRNGNSECRQEQLQDTGIRAGVLITIHTDKF